MKEVCLNCGLTYGSHHGGTSPWPMDYCPGHEGRMNWDEGPGTIFKSSGEYRNVPPGTPAMNKTPGENQSLTKINPWRKSILVFCESTKNLKGALQETDLKETLQLILCLVVEGSEFMRPREVYDAIIKEIHKTLGEGEKDGIS